MANASPRHQLRISKTAIFVLVVVAVAIYVFLPQIKDLKNSLELARNADRSDLFGVIILIIATYGFATLCYQLLARHPLKAKRTLLIETAAACANKLLPAGIGGLSLNTAYLCKNKHKLAEATTVAATNNLLGIFGHLLVLSIALIFIPSSIHLSHGLHLSRGIYIGASVAAVGIVTSLLVLPRIRKWLEDFSWQVIKDIGAYRRHPKRLFFALCSSIALTLCYVSALLVCMRAFGVTLDFTQVLIIFSLGSVVGIATPTPGGIVGVEAGLIAGCIAFGVSSPRAVAVVLTFRFISYWLPIVPGFVALVYAQRRHYISGA